MTLSQLRYFCEVFRRGNVTLAAELLHISQPSVSTAIKDLEGELGIKLFYRRKRRLIPTDEGERFYCRAVEILERVDALSDEMRAIGEKAARIRVGVSPMLSIMIFSPLYRAFHQRHEAIGVEMCEYGSIEAKALVLDDVLDMAIVILDDIDENKFHILPLLETQLVFCVDQDHPFAGSASIAIPDLADQDLILMKATSYSLGARIYQLFSDAGITPRVQLHSSQLFIIQQHIHEHGTGAFLMQEILNVMPGTVGIPLDPPQTVKVGLVWKKGSYLSSSASKFWEFASSYKNL